MSSAEKSPARIIRANTRSNVGYLPSTKVVGGVAEYESRIERDFYLLLDHCPSVISYQHQPFGIPWKDDKGADRSYTPDTLVILKNGTRYLVEIKMEDDIRLIIPIFKDAWKAADEHARSKGIKFILVTDKTVRKSRLFNVWFTRPASRENTTKLSQDLIVLSRMMDRYQKGIEYWRAATELAGILNVSVGSAARIISYAIYHGLVSMDGFSTSNIANSTILRPILPEIPPFEELFSVLEPYPVEYIVNGTLSIQTENEPHENQVTYPIIPPKYMAIVQKRRDIVKEFTRIKTIARNDDEQLQEFLKKVGFSERTIMRWGKKHDEEGLEGLIPLHTNKGRKSIFGEDVNDLMERYVEKFIAEPYSTIKGIYSLLANECNEKGEKCPTYSTFRGKVRNIPAGKRDKSKKGVEYYRRKYLPIFDTFKDGIMPMQVLQFDNTPLDIFPVDSEEREPLRAPYLVAAIDVYTHMITGHYLTYDNPSRLSVLEVLVMSMLSKESKTAWRETGNEWPIQGLPLMMLVDNGMDYRAKDVQKFCKKHGIILEYAPIRKPEYKGLIEQWFEILNKDLKNEGVPGYRPPLKLRKDMKDVNPEERSAVTLVEMERWLTSWIVDTYHARTQSKDLAPSPLMKFTDAEKGKTSILFPSPIILEKTEESMLYFDSLNKYDRKLTRKGVQYRNLTYNSKDLQEMHENEGINEIKVLLDPRDVRVAFACHPTTGEIFKVPSTAGWERIIQSRFGDHPVSESAWKEALDSARMKNRTRVTIQEMNLAEMQRRQELLEAMDATRKHHKIKKNDRLKREKVVEHERRLLDNGNMSKNEKHVESGENMYDEDDDDDYKPKLMEFEVLDERFG